MIPGLENIFPGGLGEMMKRVAEGRAEPSKDYCGCGKFSCNLAQSHLNDIDILVKATADGAPALTPGKEYKLIELRHASLEDKSLEGVVIDDDGVKCVVNGTWGKPAEAVSGLHVVIEPEMMTAQVERLKLGLAQQKAASGESDTEASARSTLDKLRAFYGVYHSATKFKEGDFVTFKEEYKPDHLACNGRGIVLFIVLDANHKAAWPHGEPTDLLLGYIDTDGERVVIASSSFRMELIQE